MLRHLPPGLFHRPHSALWDWFKSGLRLNPFRLSPHPLHRNGNNASASMAVLRLNRVSLWTVQTSTLKVLLLLLKVDPESKSGVLSFLMTSTYGQSVIKSLKDVKERGDPVGRSSPDTRQDFSSILLTFGARQFFIGRTILPL